MSDSRSSPPPSTPSTKNAPAVADPGTSVLVYDGECSFCTASAERLAVPAKSRQDAGWTAEDTHGAVVWIDSKGARHFGADAIARALVHRGGWRGVAGRVLLLPPFSWIARAGYPVIARNRHRLPG